MSDDRFLPVKNTLTRKGFEAIRKMRSFIGIYGGTTQHR